MSADRGRGTDEQSRVSADRSRRGKGRVARLWLRGVRLSREWRWLLSPAGAGLALICFFLPWGRFSCVGLHRTVTGTGLGGGFWTVFFAAFLILAAGGVLVRLRRPKVARVLVAACCVYVFAFLVSKSIVLSRGIGTPVGHIRPPVAASPRFGGVGLLLGFLLAGAGAAVMRPRSPRE